MQYVPHDYQAHAIQFIEEHKEAAVFLSMGMGKTIITLTAINTLLRDTFKVCRVLIIAPLRVARDTWPAELDKWDHLAGLTMAVAVGSKKEREEALAQDADITVINRENIPWLVKHTGKKWRWDMVIIDELSSFKSHTSQRFKALRAVRPQIERIVGLTGTPAPNGLADLWAPFRLLDGGKRLGTTLTQFRQRYFHAGKRNGHIIYEWLLNDGADEEIYAAIDDMTISMKAIDHLNLPAVTTTDQTTTLGPKEQKLYRQLRDDLVADVDGETIDAGSAAILSGKLQQLSSGAIYTVDEVGNQTGTKHIHDRKLEVLDEIIEAANGQAVLVAYWFKHELERLEARYSEGRLLRDSQDIEDWNAGKIPIMFIHPASAGHGLNLQAGGHILVWLTTPWSPELYQQTNGRLDRQGQQHPVSIIHILVSGTIDTRVIQSQETKDGIQAALIDAVRAEIRQAIAA